MAAPITTVRGVPVRNGPAGLGQSIYELRRRLRAAWGLEGHDGGADARVAAEAVATAIDRGWTTPAAYRHLLDGLRAGRDVDDLIDALLYGPPPPPPVPPRPSRRQRPPQTRRTCRLPAMAAAKLAG